MISNGRRDIFVETDRVHEDYDNIEGQYSDTTLLSKGCRTYQHFDKNETWGEFWPSERLMTHLPIIVVRVYTIYNKVLGFFRWNRKKNTIYNIPRGWTDIQISSMKCTRCNGLIIFEVTITDGVLQVSREEIGDYTHSEWFCRSYELKRINGKSSSYYSRYITWSPHKTPYSPITKELL